MEEEGGNREREREEGGQEREGGSRDRLVDRDVGVVVLFKLSHKSLNTNV